MKVPRSRGSRYSPDRMQGSILREWEALGRPWRDCIVSPERAAEIQKIYPPEEFGRPGILYLELDTLCRSPRLHDGVENEAFQAVLVADPNSEELRELEVGYKQGDPNERISGGPVWR